MTTNAVLAEQVKNLKESMAELKSIQTEQDKRLDAMERFRTWLIAVAVPIGFAVGMFSDEIREAVKLVIR